METFFIDGMSCASCVSHVEKAALEVEGCTSASASLTSGTLTVNGGSPSEIIKHVKASGYGCRLMGKGETPDFDNTGEIKSIKRRLIASLVVLLPIIYLSMGRMLGFPPVTGIRSALPQLILCLLAIIINRKYFVSGIKSLLRWEPNMDALIAIGSGSSFMYSATIVILAITANNVYIYNMEGSVFPAIYFESAAMIPTFISFGKLLEALARRKTASAISSLTKLVPKTCTVLRDGEKITVEVDKVKIGETVIVNAGEVFPLDGLVTDGKASVDEASLTGEHIPVFKSVGDTVLAGSVNTNGCISFSVTKESFDTSLSKIIKLVSGASSSKAPIGRITDKVAGYFVPVVILISLITTVYWFISSQDLSVALKYGVSVLVISCPCALGLATPVAITVGCGIGAKHGILFRTAEALENLGKTQICVLDKTGTVTKGKPTVCDIIGDSEKLLPVALSLESASSHPLAKAITDYCNDLDIKGLSVTDFSETPGIGLCGTIDGRKYTACGLGGIPENLKNVEFLTQAESVSNGGKTPLVFLSENEIIGIITVSDEIKEDSIKGIQRLKKMGIRTVMLSGDTSSSAKAVGEKTGIDEVISGVLPDKKAEKVLELRNCGFTAMVGDGINDAPALVSANIGASMASGTDIAAQSSDILLMNSSLDDFATGINLSKNAMRIIRQNLVWAFFYNIIGIPIAAGCFASLGISLTPAVCSLLMSVSSLTVVSNALRLNLLSLTSDGRSVKPAKEKEKMSQVTVKIKGMMCEHCEMRVKNAIEENPCVDRAVVSAEKGLAVITVNRVPNMAKIYKSIERAGYTPVQE